MIYRHARYDLVSFYELPEQARPDYDGAQDSSYLINIKDETDIHDLDSFMAMPDGRYDAIASCTNTSCHGLILSADNSQAVLALIG